MSGLEAAGESSSSSHTNSHKRLRTSKSPKGRSRSGSSSTAASTGPVVELDVSTGAPVVLAPHVVPQAAPRLSAFHASDSSAAANPVVVNNNNLNNTVVLLDDSDDDDDDVVVVHVKVTKKLKPSRTPAYCQSTQTDRVSTSAADVIALPAGGAVAGQDVKKKEEDDKKYKCPVCLESFSSVVSSNVKVMSTKCGHLFCENCLMDSLRSNNRTCPTCRTKLATKTSYHAVYFA